VINSVIIEDDSFQMQILTDLLTLNFPQINIIGRCGSANEGIETIKERKPDLIILDIDLPDKSGFEMLDELREFNFELLFITSHEKYALEAYKHNPAGYLVKPIDKLKLGEVINTVSGKLQQKRFGNEFAAMLKYFKQTHNLPLKIAIPSIKEISYVNIDNILRLEADGNYTTIFQLKGDPIFSSRKLGRFEIRLADHQFFRIHDKYMVNLRHVKSFIKGESGIAVMEDGTQLPVSRRRKDAFLKLLDALFE
jgi:two-component system, LytTR family, response regulator